MRIVDVTSENFEEAAAVLGAAFSDYAVFTFVLPPETADRERKLLALMRYYAWRRFVRSWPLLAVEEDGRLLAVIAANPPHDGTPPPDEAEAERELVAVIGEEAEQRRRAYESASGGGFPDVPKFFVGMIGVRPEARGRGLGKALMTEILHRSRAHPESRGIALCTESRDNLPFYRALGFDVVDHADGPIESWSLWRYNDG